MRYILSLLLFCFISTNLPAQWEHMDTPPLGGLINCLVSIDSNIFAGNWKGLYLSTQNGSNWKGIDSTKTIFSLAICGNNIYKGTLAGLYSSTDYGINWNRITNSMSDSIIYKLITSENNIYAISNNNDLEYKRNIYLSTNNGFDWKKINNDLLDSIKSIAVNNNNIVAATVNRIFFSSDNGVNWEEKNKVLQTDFIYTLAFKNNNLYVGTRNGIFEISITDSTWNVINEGLTNLWVSALFIKDSLIFVDASGDIYFKKIDDTQWIEINNGLLYKLSITSFDINSDYIFAASQMGVYRAKLSDFGISSVDETKTSNNPDILIYPNPAGNEVCVRFENELIYYTNYIIYNVMGEKILDGIINAGSKEQRINIEQLSIGLYFIKINNKCLKFVKN